MSYPLNSPKPAPPVQEPGWAIRLLHIVFSLLGWGLFGFFWFEVFYRTPPEEGVRGILAILVLLAASVAITLAWVRHNLLLSRRFQNRRRYVRDVFPKWTHDAIGRPLVSQNWEVLQEAQVVEVQIDSMTGRKVYKAA